ncbi:hypothetical protein EMGR_006136, partial [Emarellia grisea]
MLVAGRATIETTAKGTAHLSVLATRPTIKNRAHTGRVARAAPLDTGVSIPWLGFTSRRRYDRSRLAMQEGASLRGIFAGICLALAACSSARGQIPDNSVIDNSMVPPFIEEADEQAMVTDCESTACDGGPDRLATAQITYGSPEYNAMLDGLQASAMPYIYCVRENSRAWAETTNEAVNDVVEGAIGSCAGKYKA